MGTIKSYQEQVQDIVEKAITAVEEQHKAVADASFDLAEKVYKLDSVKTKHDDVASLAYDKARDVNKFVGEYAADIIAKFEKEDAPAKAAPKKTAAKKAPAKKKPAAKSAAAKAETEATA